MSSSPFVNNRQSTNEILSYAVQYFIPPLAASTAIIPVFYGFIAKSAQQIGQPLPKMTITDGLKAGVRSAPTLGFIVGTQMIFQSIVEKALLKNKEKPSFKAMLVSAAIVGTFSAPALAVFNGQTITPRRTMKNSLKSLSAQQTMAIVTRETSFLLSLRLSDPLGEVLKRNFGNNKAVEYISAFVSGAIGSVIGHPADTALTLWQKGMRISNFTQSMRGAPIKAISVGGFSVLYKLTNDIFQKLSS